MCVCVGVWVRGCVGAWVRGCVRARACAHSRVRAGAGAGAGVGVGVGVGGRILVAKLATRKGAVMRFGPHDAVILLSQTPCISSPDLRTVHALLLLDLEGIGLDCFEPLKFDQSPRVEKIAFAEATVRLACRST